MTINANSTPATVTDFETFWADFPDVAPKRETAFAFVLKSIMDKGIRSPHALPVKADAHRDIVLTKLASKFREPVVLGYHDDYQILFGLENFRAAFAAGYRDADDYVLLKFAAPAPALKAAALAHEYRNNRKCPFGDLVKVVAEEGLGWVDTYGEFIKANNSDMNVLRTAYAHGLESHIKDYPIAVLKGVIKNKLPLILSGRIDAKAAMEMEADDLRRKNSDENDETNPELKAAISRANRAEKKAEAMDLALREFMTGIEDSRIPKRYRNELVGILKAAVANNPAS